MNNQDNLLLWIYERYPSWAFKTSDFKEYAYKHLTNRADRDKRILCEKGLLRRITDDWEKQGYGYFDKQSMYIITEIGVKKAKSLGQMSMFLGERNKMIHLTTKQMTWILVVAMLLGAFCGLVVQACFGADQGVRLSEHFVQKEFACKHCGETRVNFMLIMKLEELRKHLNTPIIITSGYRCEIHNKAVGGSKNSQHLYGNAVDIRVRSFTPFEVSEIAKEVGFTFTKVYSTWTHIDIRSGVHGFSAK